MDYETLETNVLNWAGDKGIMERGTPMGQAIKTAEECNELLLAINDENPDEIKDALGDILVTIIIQAELQNLSLVDCLQSAYDIISKRKGEMVNGQFVKNGG